MLTHIPVPFKINNICLCPKRERASHGGGWAELDFRGRVLEHLGEYKRTVLGVAESGKWRGKCYSHILPETMMTLNLIEGYRGELWEFLRHRRIKLHGRFHHLNSSQAVCFNFFYPMLAEGVTGLLLDVLQCGSEVFDGGEFEYVSPLDKTNFDFRIRQKSGGRIFIEVKYTEDKFGGAEDDDVYRDRYNGTYKPHLAGKIRDGVDPYQALIAHYQLLRNIAHVDLSRNDRLILLYPKDNLKVVREIDHVMNRIVSPALHDRIKPLTWESVLQDLKREIGRRSDPSDRLPDRFVNHYKEFERKYFSPARSA